MVRSRAHGLEALANSVKSTTFTEPGGPLGDSL